jgi:DNA recombination protein RmuC
MTELFLALFVAFLFLAFVVVLLKLHAISKTLRDLPLIQAEGMEHKHRAMLTDLHEGLSRSGERTGTAIAESGERVRGLVSQELHHTREALQVLQLTQGHELSNSREALLARLGDISTSVQTRLVDQGNADRELLETQLREMRHEVTLAIEQLTRRIDERLDQSASRTATSLDALAQRLDERLTRTTETLVASIDALVQRFDERLTQTNDRLIATIDGLSQRTDERLEQTTARLVQSIEGLTRRVDERLELISGKVSERLDEGFRKTNETFANVMARLATIDEAQKKIDGLTTNVVSLQELLGDKRSRGAFGEVQLENIVRNILPPAAYAFQHTLKTGVRADCVLHLPEPTGMVAVDSKFPLDIYHALFDPATAESDRVQVTRQFKAGMRRHIDDIQTKYIVAGETSDGAVLFVPAEAIFAELHAYHPDVVEYAMQKRVWIVSPTTLMAVLNTARAVLKDVETRRQVHIIKDELAKLGKDFGRFDERMRKLADHIRQAHEDAERVQVSSQKITQRFARIEAVELEHPGIGAVTAEAGGAAPVALPELVAGTVEGAIRE